ncbi:MAG: sigma-70 family RNA polymerase sigma factor [Bacteroidales bacterium]|nr:sigma-70 family RNA polymerase sigma factor [Bacteroidales bacterium]
MTDIEFTKVYLDTYKDLCLLALRLVHSVSVAEDIVQDAFCQVLVRRPEVFSFEDDSQTRAYIWRTVRNKAIDWYRRNSGRSSSLDEQTLDIELSLMMDKLFAPENYGLYDYEVLSQTLSDVVSGLPPRAREVYTLRRDKGLSNQEVASQLGVTVKAVEKQMTLCLKRLRRAFQDKRLPFILLLYLFLN